MHNQVLGIGLTGKTLTDLERKIIVENSPYAIILFGRNVGDTRQLRELVAEVKRIARRPPLFMIDEEGGRVDRLRHLIPGLPSVESFAEGDQPAEFVDVLRLGAHDDVVGSGDVFGGHDSVDPAHLLGHLGRLAHLSLNEDVSADRQGRLLGREVRTRHEW